MEEFSITLQHMQSSTVGSGSPPFRPSRTWASLACHFRYYFFHLCSLVQILGCGPTVGFPWSSLEGVGQHHHHQSTMLHCCVRMKHLTLAFVYHLIKDKQTKACKVKRIWVYRGTLRQDE